MLNGERKTRRKNITRILHKKEVASLLTAEEYRTRYLLGGNASHSRLMHYARMVRREANA